MSAGRGKYTGYQFRSKGATALVGHYNPVADYYDMSFDHVGDGVFKPSTTTWPSYDINMITEAIGGGFAWKLHYRPDPIDKLLEELYPTSSSDKS